MLQEADENLRRQDEMNTHRETIRNIGLPFNQDVLESPMSAFSPNHILRPHIQLSRIISKEFNDNDLKDNQNKLRALKSQYSNDMDAERKKHGNSGYLLNNVFGPNVKESDLGQSKYSKGNNTWKQNTALAGSKDNWLRQLSPEQKSINHLIKSANKANVKQEWIDRKKLQFDLENKEK